MNHIACKYYLDCSLELASFCVGFDPNFSKKVFYLNVSLCIELLLKNLIIFQKYNQITESVNEDEYQTFLKMIKSELQSYHHDLVRLFNFDKDLEKELGLISISKKINQYVNQFELVFKDHIVLVTTFEAARYNVFAGNQNVIDSNSTNNIDNIKKIIEGIVNYIKKTIKY